jgi:hypothetical protein
MNRPADKGTWRCTWCRDEIPHNTEWRSPLPVSEGWPTGTGQIVCGPSCRHKPVGVSVYRHWGRGA